MTTKLKVCSIFGSFDGEVNGLHQGRMSTFLRLAQCNLSCKFCDTKYANFKRTGEYRKVGSVALELTSFKNRKITITGGEPLLQQTELFELVKTLKKWNYLISIETNGSIPIPPWQYLVDSWVVDYKLPGSGIQDTRMKAGAFKYLGKNDFVKFVITSYNDFKKAIEAMRWIRKISETEESDGKPLFAFSPCFRYNGKGMIHNTEQIIEWIKNYNMKQNRKLDVVLNVQIHKLLFPDIDPAKKEI